MAFLVLDLEAEVKPYLNAENADGDDEAFLERLEANLIGIIEADTNWRFRTGSAGEQFIVEGKGNQRLWLPSRAITLSSIETRADLTSTWETLATTAYELSPSRSNALRIDGLAWPTGDALIRLTGTWGYAAADVPNDVRLLLLEMMNWSYRKGRKMFGDHEVFVRMKTETNFDQVLRRYRGPAYG